jgi:aspartyl-tRNA(Asn)/glutamyl-tRNA(Gln) amidotransferase subunit A
VSIPVGFGRNRLPLGLQIAGPRYADARVLAAAWQAERTFGLDMRSPVMRHA